MLNAIATFIGKCVVMLVGITLAIAVGHFVGSFIDAVIWGGGESSRHFAAGWFSAFACYHLQDWLWGDA